MVVEEVVKMLRWINEADPRVQFNEAAVEQWLYALRGVDASVAKQAILEHVKLHEGVPVSPAAISKRAGYIKSSRKAFETAQAIEPSPSQQNASDGKLFRSWRQRNPEEWARRMAEGAADRKRDLEARGLPSHFPGRAA